MLYHKFLTATAVALLSTGQLKADGIDLSAHTYEWTATDGTVMTSTLEETATELPQMKALVIKVYSDRSIPGIKTVKGLEFDMKTPEDHTLDYKDVNNLNRLNRFYGLDETVDYKPFEHGITALLVEYKDDYRGTKEWVDINAANFNSNWARIKSIKVIKSVTYCADDEGENGGYLINITQPLHAFSVMLKGNSSYNHQMPFFGMYEQLSPSSNALIIDNGYERMRRGETFDCSHNCSTITGTGHVTWMSAIDKVEYPNCNLLVFIPDYRFYYDYKQEWLDNKDKPASEQLSGWKRPKRYVHYLDAHKPFFYFYTIDQKPTEVEYNTEDVTDTKAQVVINWHSSQKDITKDNFEEEFEIYRSYNDEGDGKWTRVSSEDIEIVMDDSRKNDDGVVYRSAADVTVKVSETRDKNVKYVSYFIRGRVGGSDFKWVESNIQSAVTPGWRLNADLGIEPALTHRSIFDISKMVNHYENKIDAIQSADTPLKRGHILPGSKFELRRYDSSDEYPYDDPGKGHLVGTTIITDLGVEDNSHYDYKAVITVGDKSFEKTLKSDYVDGGAVDLDQPLTDENGEATLWTVNDIFDYDVANGADSNNYTYRIYGSNLNIAAGEGTFTSIMVNKRMRAQTATGTVVTYDREEIAGDTDHHLNVSTPAVIFKLQNFPRIRQCELVTADGLSKIATVNRGTSGEYSFNLYDVSGAPAPSDIITDDNFSGDTQVPVYLSWQNVDAVLISKIVDEQNSDVINTYGAPQTRLPELPTVEIVMGEFSFEQKTDDSGVVTARASWLVDSKSKVDFYNHYGFGAWRRVKSQIDDMETNIHHLDYTHESSTIEDLVKSRSADLSASSKSHTEVFADQPLPVGGNSFIVGYVVRHYSEPVNMPGRYVITQNDKTEFYIDESLTSIDDIEAVDRAITIVGGRVIVEGGAEIAIYDAAGRLVYAGQAPSPVLNHGFYIVKAGDKNAKITL